MHWHYDCGLLYDACTCPMYLILVRIGDAPAEEDHAGAVVPDREEEGPVADEPGDGAVLPVGLDQLLFYLYFRHSPPKVL